MISDYTMSSLVNSAVALNWFDVEKTMQGDDVSQYISGFAEAYGSRTDVQISLKPVAGTQ